MNTIIKVLIGVALISLTSCMTRDGVVKQAQPGAITIVEQSKQSARVFLNGKEIGTMNNGLFTIEPISTGKHEIVLFREGFSLALTTVVLSEGEQKNILIELNSAESGTVSVEAEPGSMVELAGLKLGVTDSTGIFTQGGFPVGDYPLLISSGSSTLDTAATIQAGKTATISAKIELQQSVLVEYLSNTDCNYCPAYGKIMYEILDSMNNRRILKIASHANWPGKGDPFFAFNPKPQEELAKQYGPKLKYALPMFAVNGEPIQHNGDTALFRSLFLETVQRKLAEPAQLAMNLTHESISITNRSDSTFTGTLFVNLTEKKVVLDKAPGTNGETSFADLFRYQPLKETGVSIAPGESVERTFVVSTDKLTGGTALKLTAFLQQSSSLRVYQSVQISY